MKPRSRTAVRSIERREAVTIDLPLGATDLPLRAPDLPLKTVVTRASFEYEIYSRSDQGWSAEPEAWSKSVAVDGNGPRPRTALAHPVRLRHQFPHHLSRLHHRARRVAGDPRGDAAGDRQPGLSARVRLLAEGVRALVRHGRGHWYRHGVSVRHQLERAGGAHRTDPGAACSATKASPRSCWRRRSSA